MQIHPFQVADECGARRGLYDQPKKHDWGDWATHEEPGRGGC